LAWALAGLLGIALTAVITWEASRLASQHIGLASQPLSVTRQLAPPAPARTVTHSPSAASHHQPSAHAKRTHLRVVKTAPPRPATSTPAAPITAAGAATSAPAGHATQRHHRARGGDRSGQQTQDRGYPTGGTTLPAGAGGAQGGSAVDGSSDDGRGGDGSSDDRTGATGASGVTAQPDD